MVVSEKEARGWRRLQNYCYFWLNYKAVLKKKRASSGQSFNNLRNKENNVRIEL